jgi:hypothetical protein
MWAHLNYRGLTGFPALCNLTGAVNHHPLAAETSILGDVQ